ncbi:MAG: thioredoxin domain-containing protein, partial [Candidatus Kapaibacteriota bacterium]
MKPNRLINEKSPYLLQHAYNPVEWYPWSEEAFEKAKELEKPIFLSIGYSTCHWCHVMERESFNDPEVAEILNEVFVCIKVDREERPDIDAFYMKVCQMMTGNGGWPLTIIMTPDKKPFFAGTYFPKYSYTNRIGLVDLARNVDRVWKTQREDVENSTKNFLEYLLQKRQAYEGKVLEKSYIDEVFVSLQLSFDKINGGFGSAPKFPTPHNLLFLINYYFLSKKENAIEMVEHTLKKMRLGGIFDHIGFGFHRYSTDSRWILPHFEKMLYDQGMLLYAYSQAYKVTRNEFFQRVAKEIVEYSFRELLYQKQAFYSSEDADSEGVEGKFYLFDYHELESLIKEDFEIFKKIYSISPIGNFDDPFGHNQNKNLLYMSTSLDEIALREQVQVERLLENVTKWRNYLFTYREGRIKPFKDKKILTDWNGLMIAGLANYYSITNSMDALEILHNYVDFFLHTLSKSDGKIFHMYFDGESRIDGFLDDYAFSIFAFFEIFEKTQNYLCLKLAYQLINRAIELFWDEEEKAFQFNQITNDELPVNPVEFFDGSIPSGNSMMYYVLKKFYLIT